MPRPCVLSDLCNGKDELEHYAVCPYIVHAMQKKLRIPTSKHSLARFLCLSLDIGDDYVISAANVYAVLSITNFHRAANSRCISDALPNQLWEAHRTLSVYHKGLRKRYTDLWTIRAKY